MTNIISFPRKAIRLNHTYLGVPVRVVRYDGEWQVACRKHSWSFPTRREAQDEARAIAEGFGERGFVVTLGGAA